MRFIDSHGNEYDGTEYENILLCLLQNPTSTVTITITSDRTFSVYASSMTRDVCVQESVCCVER